MPSFIILQIPFSTSAFRRGVSLAGLIVGSALAGAAANPAIKPPAFMVRRPMIVAFFPPVTESDLSDDDTNEALSDFQVYAGEAREPLRKMGVEFHEVHVQSFRIRLGRRITTFRPGESDVGYYFIAPGRAPRVEYGVRTDVDILEIAKEYFAN